MVMELVPETREIKLVLQPLVLGYPSQWIIPVVSCVMFMLTFISMVEPAEGRVSSKVSWP